jgi:hypothetical protein
MMGPITTLGFPPPYLQVPLVYHYRQLCPSGQSIVQHHPEQLLQKSSVQAAVPLHAWKARANRKANDNLLHVQRLLKVS